MDGRPWAWVRERPALMGLYTVDSAPHLRGRDDIPRIMWDVVIALVPALAAAAWFFGWYALVLVTVSTVTAVVTEGVIQKLRRVPVTIGDGSAAVTGILLAFVIPPNAPLYVAIVGSFFSIAVVKQCFGGLGNNIWNPALGGRAFLHFAYPVTFNAGAWALLQGGRRLAGNIMSAVDSVSAATPLKVLKSAAAEMGEKGAADLLMPLFGHQEFVVAGETMRLPTLAQMFLGVKGGCIGEISGLALIAGGIYLLVRKRIKWQVPVLYAGTVFALTAVLPMAPGTAWLPGLLVGLYHVLAGGLLLGALFMATDMVTSPITVKGQVIFAVGCGILTALIRLFGGFPEGVCFSILLMNTAVPLIDRYTQPRVFGV